MNENKKSTKILPRTIQVLSQQQCELLKELETEKAARHSRSNELIYTMNY